MYEILINFNYPVADEIPLFLQVFYPTCRSKASCIWLQPPGLYSSVAEAARSVAKSRLTVAFFGVMMPPNVF